MNYFCLRFNPEVDLSSTACEWMYLDEGANPISHGECLLQDMGMNIRMDDDVRVVVLIAGNSVLTTEVVVESQHAAHIKKIIPHLVEEQLADELEDVHIALAPGSGAGINPIAVVSHTELINWLDILYGVDLQPWMIVPEYQNLPAANSSVRVLLDRGKAIVQFSEFLGTVMEPENLATYLRLHFDYVAQQHGCETAAELGDMASVSLIANQQDDTAMHHMQQFAGQMGSITVSQEPRTDTAFAMLASSAVKQQVTALNLLQGGYRMQEVAGPRFPWKRLAGIAALFLVAELAMFTSSGLWFGQKADRLHDAAVAEYRAIFPQERRVVNPKRQFQSHLNRQQSAGFSSEYLYLLQHIAEAMPERAMPISTMRYDAYGGGLMLDLKAANMDELESYTAVLASQPVQVELLSAVKQGDFVNGRIRVEAI